MTGKKGVIGVSYRSSIEMKCILYNLTKLQYILTFLNILNKTHITKCLTFSLYNLPIIIIFVFMLKNSAQLISIRFPLQNMLFSHTNGHFPRRYNLPPTKCYFPLPQGISPTCGNLAHLEFCRIKTKQLHFTHGRPSLELLSCVIPCDLPLYCF